MIQDIPNEVTYSPKGVLGIDLGINNIVVDSDRQIFTSGKIEVVRKKYNELRSALQKVGTKSAKRKLKRLSGRERRHPPSSLQ